VWLRSKQLPVNAAREIISVYSEIVGNNTVCGKNIELLNAKEDITYSNECALEC
jgi:hypothetical protein